MCTDSKINWLCSLIILQIVHSYLVTNISSVHHKADFLANCENFPCTAYAVVVVNCKHASVITLAQVLLDFRLKLSVQWMPKANSILKTSINKLLINVGNGRKHAYLVCVIIPMI